MTKQRLALVSLTAALLLGAAGCVHHVHHRGGPPYAPTQGHRYHYDHDDVDLVWDAGLGVYAVVGFPSVYFWDGRYYRYHERAWQRAARPRGYWEPYRGHVPPGLAKKYHRRHKKFKRGRKW